jgi:ATP-dependent exoDNAse (exonuclease V) alpha subunit
LPFPEDIFPNNKEVLNAHNLAEYTNKSFYITGKAGTGKSTFLRHFCNNSSKKFLVLAPTGLAALNIGGQTIHSFFNLPWRPLSPNDKGIPYFPKAKIDEKGNIEETEHYKRTIIKKLDLIIIDEVSMVRPDQIDAIDNSLRKNGGNYHLPFGGKQIIFIGDLFQLEPVITKDDLPIVSKFYDSPFFFSALIFQQIQFSFIELIRVYRQSDPKFINLLDKIRKRTALDIDFSELNKKLNVNYQPDKNHYFITLCSKNDIADKTNVNHLNWLTSEEFEYEGIIEGNFEKNLPTPRLLKLKLNAQIMFVKNDAGGRWVNGTIGKITELTNETIKVKIKNESGEDEYYVERVRWEKIEYRWNNKTEEIETEIVGTFTQFPLKLAWAITIHKSQGLTFDQVIIDSGDGMFAHGQLYVALSRCTSFEGIVLKQRVLQKDMIVNPKVIQITASANDQQIINQQLLSGLLENAEILSKRKSQLQTNEKLLLERITKLKIKLEDKEKEIERLKEIKWYQKLIGTK